ncbi:MAG: ParB/RepB/Spo0J family partition protein [Gemmatimonadetes bacterium]|nr:ParB/RepB/Spo0J family partition protein [Gemmatimonadota bacterium]MBI3081437.1 ParB/RepB/Spo0J family partition protein [Gemmatimonadota bacterium]
MTEPRTRRLGRGLEALLGPALLESRAEGSARQIPLSALRPNPYQPRHDFPEEALAELTESLRTSGLLQPIVVRPADGHYEIIAGERRWRAAERLGWQEISAVVRDVDDRTLLALALVENLQRDGLSPIDEARGYHRLMSEFNASHADVAELIGRDRSTVANAVRLLKLPEAVQQMVHDGRLTTGHARALLQLSSDQAIARLAGTIVERGLSVREVERLARGDQPAARRAVRGRRRPAPQLQRVEDVLRRRLQTDVYVMTRGKGGRITINFYSNDDLARLLEIVLGEPFAG